MQRNSIFHFSRRDSFEIMNKSTVVIFCFIFLLIFVSADYSTCPQVSTFPSWMLGKFFVQYPDGSIGNKTAGLWYANVTLPNGTRGTLTMTAPLNRSDHFFINRDCLQLQNGETQQRCSLVVPNCNGYTLYVYNTPELVSTCPDSTTSPGIEKQITERSG